MLSQKNIPFITLLCSLIIVVTSCNKEKSYNNNSKENLSTNLRDTLQSYNNDEELFGKEYDINTAFRETYLSLKSEEHLRERLEWVQYHIWYLIKYGKMLLTSFHPSGAVQDGNVFRYELITLPDSIQYMMSAISKLPFSSNLFFVQYTKENVFCFRDIPLNFVSYNLLSDDRKKLSPAGFQIFPDWVIIYSLKMKKGVPSWACALNYKGAIIGLVNVIEVNSESIIVNEFHIKSKDFYDKKLIPEFHRVGYYHISDGKRFWASTIEGSIIHEYFYQYAVTIQ